MYDDDDDDDDDDDVCGLFDIFIFYFLE